MPRSASRGPLGQGDRRRANDGCTRIFNFLRPVLFALLSSFLLVGTDAQRSYSQNRFKGEDALAVYVAKNATLCRTQAQPAAPPSACLQQVTLWSFEAPLGKANSLAVVLPTSTTSLGGGKFSFACTLPPLTGVGLGQLTLSADGRLLALACYAHPLGTNYSALASIDYAVALVFPDGSVDTFTRVTLPRGTTVYSAVTDNGTSVWLASDLGVHYTRVGSTAQASLLTVASSSPVTALSLPVRHVSIVNGTQLWLSSGNDVLNATKAGGSEPQLPFGSSDQLQLERLVSMIEPNSRGFVAGHAATILPRGAPRRDVPANDFESIYSNSSAQILPSVARLVLSRPVFNGSNLDVFASSSSSSPSTTSWQPQNGSSQPVLQSGFSILHVSAVGTRYNPHKFEFYGDLTGSAACNVLGTVYATTPAGVYNHSLIDGRQFGVDAYPTQLMYGHTLRWQELLGMFLGVSIAPYDDSLPVPMPTLLPLATPSPTVNASRTPLPSASPTPPIASVTATVPPLPAAGFGVQMGPGVAKNLFPGLDTNSLLLGLARVGHANGTDFRTPDIEQVPQPLFLDIIRRDTGKVVATLPMPTRRNGIHAACTSSFSSHLMWPKVAASENPQFSSITCFDAEIPLTGNGGLSNSAEILPNSYYPPPGYTGDVSLWKHPKRIVGTIHGSGLVDTRIGLSKKNCSTHFITSGVLGPAVVGFYVYASAIPFYDSPPEAYDKCGIRYIPLATGEELDVPLVQPQDNYDDYTFLIIFTSNMYAWRGNSDFQMLHMIRSTSRVQEPVVPGAQSTPTIIPMSRTKIDSNPIFIRNFAMREYVGDRVTKAIFVNSVSSDRNNIVFIDYDADTKQYFAAGTTRAPDNRTAVDVVGGAPQFGFFPGNTRLAVIYHSDAFVVTAELNDGPNWKAGSALWKLTLVGLKWDLIAELPCCNQIWTSLMLNTMFTSPTAAPTPSATPSTSATVSLSNATNSTADPVPFKSDEIGATENAAPSPGGLSGGAIAGIAIGVVLALFCVCGGFVFVAMWRYRQLLQKRKEQLLELHKRDEEARLKREAEEERKAKEKEEAEEAKEGDSDGSSSSGSDSEGDGKPKETDPSAAPADSSSAAPDQLGPKPKTAEEEEAERAAAAEAAAKEVEVAALEKLGALTDKNGVPVGQSAAAITEALLLAASEDDDDDQQQQTGEELSGGASDDPQPLKPQAANASDGKSAKRPKSLVDAAEELNALLDSIMPGGDDEGLGQENSPDSTTIDGSGQLLEPLELSIEEGGDDADLAGAAGGEAVIRLGRSSRQSAARASGGGRLSMLPKQVAKLPGDASSSSLRLRSLGTDTVQTANYRLPGASTATLSTPRTSAGEQALKAVIKEMAPLLEPAALKLVLATALRSARVLATEDEEELLKQAEGEGSGSAEPGSAAAAGESKDDGAATRKTRRFMTVDNGEELVPLEVTVSEIEDVGGGDDSVVEPLKPFANPLRSASGKAVVGAATVASPPDAGAAAVVQTVKIGMSSAKKGLTTTAAKKPGGGSDSESADGSSRLVGQRSASSLFTTATPRQVLQSIVAAALKTATEFHDEFVASTVPLEGQDERDEELLKPGRRQTHLEGARLSVLPSTADGSDGAVRKKQPGLAALLAPLQAGSGASGEADDDEDEGSDNEEGPKTAKNPMRGGTKKAASGGTGEAPDGDGDDDEFADQEPGAAVEGEGEGEEEEEEVEVEQEVEESVEEDELDGEGKPTGEKSTTKRKVIKKLVIKRKKQQQPSAPGAASKSGARKGVPSMALVGTPRKPTQSRPLSMALLHQNPDLFAKLQQRIEQASLDAGKLAVLEGYRARKAAVSMAVDRVTGEQEAARLAAVAAAAAAAAAASRPRSGVYSATDHAGREKRRKNREKAKGKKKDEGKKASGKDGDEEEEEELDPKTGKKRRKPSRKGSRLPDLAELERKYGSLGGSGREDEEPLVPPPPGFVPFLGWFIRQQFSSLFGPLMRGRNGKDGRDYYGHARRGTGKGGPQRRFTDNDARVAAFAGLGLSKSDAGAFVLQNALLAAGDGGAGNNKRTSFLLNQGLTIGADGTVVAPARGGVRSAVVTSAGAGFGSPGLASGDAAAGGGDTGRIYVKPIADSRFKEAEAAAGGPLGASRGGIASVALLGNIAAALSSITTTASAAAGNGQEGAAPGSQPSVGGEGGLLISMSNPLRAPRSSNAGLNVAAQGLLPPGHHPHGGRRSSIGGRRASGLLSGLSFSSATTGDGGGTTGGGGKRGSLATSHTLPEAYLRGVQAYHAGAATTNAILGNASAGVNAGASGGGAGASKRVRVVRGSLLDPFSSEGGASGGGGGARGSKVTTVSNPADGRRRSTYAAGRKSVVGDGRFSLSTSALGISEEDDDNADDDEGVTGGISGREKGEKAIAQGVSDQHRSAGSVSSPGAAMTVSVDVASSLPSSPTAPAAPASQASSGNADASEPASSASSSVPSRPFVPSLDQNAVFRAADSAKFLKRGSRVAPSAAAFASAAGSDGAVFNPALLAGDNSEGSTTSPPLSAQGGIAGNASAATSNPLLSSVTSVKGGMALSTPAVVRGGGRMTLNFSAAGSAPSSSRTMIRPRTSSSSSSSSSSSQGGAAGEAAELASPSMLPAVVPAPAPPSLQLPAPAGPSSPPATTALTPGLQPQHAQPAGQQPSLASPSLLALPGPLSSQSPAVPLSSTDGTNGTGLSGRGLSLGIGALPRPAMPMPPAPPAAGNAASAAGLATVAPTSWTGAPLPLPVAAPALARPPSLAPSLSSPAAASPFSSIRNLPAPVAPPVPPRPQLPLPLPSSSLAGSGGMRHARGTVGIGVAGAQQQQQLPLFAAGPPAPPNPPRALMAMALPAGSSRRLLGGLASDTASGSPLSSSLLASPPPGPPPRPPQPPQPLMLGASARSNLATSHMLP